MMQAAVGRGEGVVWLALCWAVGGGLYLTPYWPSAAALQSAQTLQPDGNEAEKMAHTGQQHAHFRLSQGALTTWYCTNDQVALVMLLLLSCSAWCLQY